MSAELAIKRRASLIAFARRAHVLIDGQEVAAIANGQTIKLKVPPGQHTVAVKLGMASGSPSTVEFSEGQIHRLDCAIRMGFSATEFVLIDEAGKDLQGDAGPAGHHGPIVIILGIIGFLVGIVGLLAVIQGVIDLVKMAKGKVDPSGRAMTIVGMVLGMLGFLFNLVLILIYFRSNLSHLG